MMRQSQRTRLGKRLLIEAGEVEAVPEAEDEAVSEVADVDEEGVEASNLGLWHTRRLEFTLRL